MKKQTVRARQKPRANAKAGTKGAVTRKDIQSLRGKFTGKGLMKALMAEKRRESNL